MPPKKKETKAVRPNRISFTKAVKAFILDKMCEGMDIATICRKYPNKVPKVKSIYEKSINDDAFAKDITQAYNILYMIKQSELDELSTGLATDHYPGADPRDAYEARRVRIDSLKFELGKLAPILAKRFDKAQTVEHKGLENANLGPVIQVMNWSTQEEVPAIDSGKVIDIDSEDK